LSFELRNSDFLFFAIALDPFLETMNVLFVTHYEGLYGASRSLLNLMDGLPGYDINPHVVLPKDGDLVRELEARSIPCQIQPVVWWETAKPLSLRGRARLLSEVYRSVSPISRLVRDWGIDVVYSNSSVFPVGRIVARLNGIPHVWHVREFGDLHFSLKFILPKWLSLRFIKSSAAVICNSTAVKDYHFGSRKRDWIHVIYNGIATRGQFDAFAAQRVGTRRHEVYAFLIIGSVSPRKGQASAIEAIACLRKRSVSARLIVAGTGRKEHVDYCRQLAGELGVGGSVEFTGFLSDPYEAYFKSDCLLMCSEHEGMGRVTAEAMSAGLPVIGRNSGGTPEVITRGKTGFLYDTQEELVECMAKMVGNPELGRQLGLEGWRVAREKFAIEDYAANVYNVLQSVAP
jgi:glycosyltransferase involved in cell wall biosynthesis